MSITAKKLAQILGLSETAVSMALHGKSGVSTETRQRVIREAERNGYDFTKIKNNETESKAIYAVQCIASNACMSYTPIFSELNEGIQSVASREHIKVKQLQIWEKSDNLDRYLEDLRVSDCLGIILLATESNVDVFQKFTALNIPIVILDSYFENLRCDCVLINNETGAYLATDYLISSTKVQPGYIGSTFRIPNFEERLIGYKKAIRANGLSVSRSLIHEVSPTLDGALSDMLNLLEDNTPLARGYFCDNDIIAIGAIKALKLKGYRVPEDVAIIGFDNISESRIIEPSLTTMDVPRHYMGECAARQLLFRINNNVQYPVKISVAPTLVKRFSV